MAQTPAHTPDFIATPAPPAPPVPPPPPPAPKITRGHSCILCQQRKVKCDRQKPCSNCLKARAECIPSAPTQPRRRRRKLAETDLAGRLKRCEQLLNRHGIRFDDDDDGDVVGEEVTRRDPPHARPRPSAHPPRPPNAEKGALFADRENTHYVENTLWENLRDEIQDPKEALNVSSEEDEIHDPGHYDVPNPETFLLGFGATPKDLSALHPPPVHIFRLWQTFLTNVNPLVKLFHAPTVQQIILEASADVQHVPRHSEALMFAIYFISVTSSTNDECQNMFGEQRLSLLAKYSHATQQALVNVRFLKSLNLHTLQALLLFLLAVRQVYDPYSLWVLSGVTVRISQRLGLHRDGDHHKISPFDAEIRRRTWWQVVFLDGYSSKLAGAGFPAWLAKFDTKIPANISDSDLSPTMKEPPMVKEGPTEMMFCCLRYETAQALRNQNKFSRAGDGHYHNSGQGAAGADMMSEKDKAIDELEASFQQKFVRFCDPSIPLHLLAMYMAKSVICTMRIMAHHPRQYPDKGASMPQREKDMVFAESLKELEFDSLGHTTKAIQGFLWHITSQFQLDAFIYVLSELRHRATGELVDRAWQQIMFSLEYRPEILSDRKNSLYTAIGNLALKAWQTREDAIGVQVPPPRFVSVLRAQRNLPEPPRRVDPDAQRDQNLNDQLIYFPGQNHASGPAYLQLNNVPQAQWGSSNDFAFDNMMPEITPVDWEYWQTLMDGDLPAYNPPPDDGNGGSNWTS